MIPLTGDTNSIFYTDLQGKYGHDHSWFGAAGVGFRTITDDSDLFGLYVFGDRSESAHNKVFWDVSPGIEWMNNHWDAHINGYFPIGDTEQTEGYFFGDQLGVSTCEKFEGHTQYDDLFKEVDTVGSGIDAELGYTIPAFGTIKQIRVYLGGYYFDPRHAQHILGGLVGVRIPMTQHLALQIDDSYDNNKHNTILTSLVLRFGGGDRTDSMDVHDRLLDPIPRNLGSLDTGMAIPSKKATYDTGINVAEKKNIWFFSPNGSAYNPSLGNNQGTFTNPLSGGAFAQGTVNSINNFAPNANFFFTPGTYPIKNSLGPYSTRLQLLNGQSIFGRTNDWRLPALDSNKPTFVGRFNLSGNNSLNNLTTTGLGTNETTGIYANGANNLSLNHVMVIDYTGNTPGDSTTGIDFSNSSNINLSHVMVSNIVGTNGTNGTGGQTEIDNPGGAAPNGIDATNGTAGGNATGIKLSNTRDVKMNTVSVNDIFAGNGGNGAAGGNGGDASLNNNTSGSSIAGDGGQGGNGGNGGNGGQASGITLAKSSANLTDITVSHIKSGQGANAGDGGNGGNANANNNQDTNLTQGGVAGNGGAGGQGGNAGQSTGISSTNSTIKLEHIDITNIKAGNGGNGANSGNGGTANTNNNNDGGSSNVIIVTAGTGGNSGAAGAGGHGGNTTGIQSSGSTLKLKHAVISKVNSGSGGNGGIAGNSGSANANENVESASDHLFTDAGKGGQAGNGGNGGQAGAAAAANITAGNASINAVNFNQITGGRGGNGGAGGDGGSANVNSNSETGGNRIEINSRIKGNNTAANAGNGGNGGQGGDGGTTLGINLSANANASIKNTTISQLTGGAAGNGANAGAGGSANANSNTETGAGRFEINFNNNSTGSITTGGNGGNAGVGGNGGTSLGITTNNSTVNINQLELRQLIGGQGGSAGNGGNGGTANANNNSETNRGHMRINTNNKSPTQVGGNGGSGGNGGGGGEVSGITANNSKTNINGLKLDQFIAGGNAGNAGNGGRGGDSTTNDNSEAHKGNFAVTGGRGGNAGIAGNGGSGGSVTTVIAADGGTVHEKHITTQNLSADFGGLGGSGGSGASGGSGQATGNSAKKGTQGTSGIASRNGRNGSNGTIS